MRVTGPSFYSLANSAFLRDRPDLPTESEQQFVVSTWSSASRRSGRLLGRHYPPHPGHKDAEQPQRHQTRKSHLHNQLPHKRILVQDHGEHVGKGVWVKIATNMIILTYCNKKIFMPASRQVPSSFNLSWNISYLKICKTKQRN